MRLSLKALNSSHKGKARAPFSTLACQKCEALHTAEALIYSVCGRPILLALLCEHYCNAVPAGERSNCTRHEFYISLREREHPQQHSPHCKILSMLATHKRSEFVLLCMRHLESYSSKTGLVQYKLIHSFSRLHSTSSISLNHTSHSSLSAQARFGNQKGFIELNQRRRAGAPHKKWTISAGNDPHLLLDRYFFEVQACLCLASQVNDIRSAFGHIDCFDLDKIPPAIVWPQELCLLAY